jgi:aminopeptidase N
MPVVISKMTEEKRQAMLSAGRQMSADDRRAIRERVTRTDWANLIHSERALEQEIKTYLAASPDERAFIDYEIQQVINRKYRQRQIAKAQHTRIVLDTMKARAR